jgi:hypothetical protein
VSTSTENKTKHISKSQKQGNVYHLNDGDNYSDDGNDDEGEGNK